MTGQLSVADEIGLGQMKTIALLMLVLRQISLQAPSEEVMKMALGQGMPGNWVVVIAITVLDVETEVVVSVCVETLVVVDVTVETLVAVEVTGWEAREPTVDSRPEINFTWPERVADVLV